MSDYKLNPYLTVNGAAEAIAFYAKAFGATENTRMPAQDGKRLMHAEIVINGAFVMLSDNFPEYCGDHGEVTLPAVDKPGAVATALHYDAGPDVDAWHARAVEAGCTSIQPPSDMFWNARFAVVADPFGHRWMLNAPLATQA